MLQKGGEKCGSQLSNPDASNKGDDGYDIQRRKRFIGSITSCRIPIVGLLG